MLRNTLRFFLAPAVLLAVFAMQAEPARAAGAKIFLVHSYESDYIWTQRITEGVRQALTGMEASLEVFFLEAKRNPDAATLDAKSREILRRIDSEAPQVVIAADDAAQSHLVVPHLKGRARPQVIFCGVNAPLAAYGYPAANVSGVRERWHFREGFALLKKIAPKLRTVAVLTDESESSGYVLHDLEAQRAKGLALRLASIKRARTFQQWKALVTRYQTSADALALGVYYSLIDERTGRMVPGDEVAAWTSSANRLPTVGFADYAMGHGLLCGILESAEEQGQIAGAMARAVIEKSRTAGSLPPRINERGVVALNLKTASRLGIVIPFEIITAAKVVVQ
jgi:ABC-type uncharacterized transport system substrate-binding protein